MYSSQKLITQLVQQVGFTSWAAISTQKFSQGYNRLIRAEQQRHTPFISTDHNSLETRVTPKNYADWARSVLMVLYPYGSNPSKIPLKPRNGESRGRFACIAWGKDYHLVVKKALVNLAEELKKHDLISSRDWTFVDTSPFSERELAYEGGLGYPGRNNCLINEKNGSFVVIGGIMTETQLQETGLEVNSLYPNCLNCNKCILACPGGALKWQDGAVDIDLENCAAYLTVKKGMIPRNKRRILNDYLYGCDICQIVCPANKNIQTDFPKWGNDELTVDDIYPTIGKIMDLDNADFKKHYSSSAVYWRGRTNLQRNALIVAGNLRSVDMLPTINRALIDQRELIRSHAVWTIEQFFPLLSDKSQKESIKLLTNCRKKEKSSDVIFELDYTLDNLLN